MKVEIDFESMKKENIFEIIPAIDLIEGRCVRLSEGRYDSEKIYSEDPVAVAQSFEQQGARRVHIVDLEAARDGKATNWKVVEKVASNLSIPVELGGGIRSLEAIRQVFDLGVQWAILGSAACRNPQLVEEAAEEWGDRIIVGIDAKEGQVAIDGWTETSSKSAEGLAKSFEKLGIGGIIYTDIAKDGMLQGPNLHTTRQIAENVNLPLIASGGVSVLQDLLDLKNLGLPNVQAAIVGKAIYEGRFTVEEAVQCLSSGSD